MNVTTQATSTQQDTSSNPDSVLEVLNLAKTYGRRTVVHDVSLTVRSGEVVGLLGPNGAGKTTSFYMIVGLLRADKGSIHIDGKAIHEAPIHKRARMGLSYLPQEASIFRKMSVFDNVYSVLQMRRKIHKISIQDAKNKTISLLEELNVAHIKDELGLSLSGGERRRVEIARSLATEPQFILLDEPFAGVDPISIQDIKNIILHLKSRQIGVLITDHNVRETLQICDQAYIMSEGKVIAEGSSEEILNNHQVKEVYLGQDFSI